MRPVILIGLGSVDLLLAHEFNDVAVVMARKLMLNHIGYKEVIAKMSPYEIKQLSDDVLKDAKATGVMFPGSVNTISEIFRDPNFKPPAAIDVRMANSVFKMAQTVTSLKMGLPSLYSCDSAHYPIIALGGEVMPVPRSTRVQHDGDSAHDIIIQKGSWLERLMADSSVSRDEEGRIIIGNTPSTHPLLPKELPKGSGVQAVAPDGSPSIFFVNSRALVVVDHPEVGSIVSLERVRHSGDLDAVKKVEDDARQNSLLWRRVRDEIVASASKNPDELPSVPDTKISPRVEEILSCKNLAELSKTTVVVKR